MVQREEIHRAIVYGGVELAWNVKIVAFCSNPWMKADKRNFFCSLAINTSAGETLVGGSTLSSTKWEKQYQPRF